MCEHYADVKSDYLYRGDVLKAVPFVSLDAGPISVKTPEDPKLPTFQQAPFADEAGVDTVKYPVLCVGTLERLNGVVLTRTCEANKRPKQSKVFGSVMVAPIHLCLKVSPQIHPTNHPGNVYGSCFYGRALCTVCPTAASFVSAKRSPCR